MRVVMIRSNPVNPYPRLEKTASYLALAGYTVVVLGWDRSRKASVSERDIPLSFGGCAKGFFYHSNGSFSGGIKKNIIGMIGFELFILKWLIRHKKEYDFIHAYDFDTGFVSLFCSRLLKKKLIYDIADFYVDSHPLPKLLQRIVRKKEIKIINRADATIICSEQRKAQIAGSSPKKLCIIHNTPIIDGSLVKAFPFDCDCSLSIAYVGILGPGRFIEELLAVVADCEGIHLFIGGFGLFEKLCIDYSNKYKNIHFLGKLDYSETLSLEKACDVIVSIYDPSIPNHKYAAPNKFYEALALKKPVIMVEGTGLSNEVKEHGLGLVMAKYDRKSFLNEIELLINKEYRYPSNSYLLYEERYSWKTMKNRIQSLYQDLQK